MCQPGLGYRRDQCVAHASLAADNTDFCHCLPVPEFGASWSR
jgi:hypothetical protein